MLNICLLCYVYVGGWKSFTNNLYDLLEERGFSVKILFLRRIKTECNARKNEVFDLDLNGERKSVFLLYHLKQKVYFSLFNKDRLRRNVYYSQMREARKALGFNKTLDLSNYDCVISTEELFSNYFLANNVSAKKKIGFIHPDYKMAGFDKHIDKFFLKKIDLIAAVSNTCKNTLINTFPSLSRKIIACSNPINVAKIIEQSHKQIREDFNSNQLNIITVCRLDNSSKALDRLLSIAQRLSSKKYKYCWRIIGDGPYRTDMESFIHMNNLSHSIKLLGYKDNPFPYVKKSDLFVLQSYFEGYPTSVLEAQIVNTPVLITKYRSAEEQVIDGVNGFIVDNDEKSIYLKLEQIITSKLILKNIKCNLKKEDKNKYNNIDKLVYYINN